MVSDKIVYKSEYWFKDNQHYSFSSLYEFNSPFDLFGNDNEKDRLSWSGQYIFQHDDTCKAYVNYYNIQ